MTSVTPDNRCPNNRCPNCAEGYDCESGVYSKADDNQKFVYSVYHPDEVGAGTYAGRTYFHSGWNDHAAAVDVAKMINGFVVQTPIIADFRKPTDG